MNALPRCLLCALAAQTLLFGMCALHFDLTERLDLNVLTVSEKERQIKQDQREMERVDVALSEVQIRIGDRERIADEVSAGRMGILEAADRFRELNASARPTPLTLEGRFDGDSEDERCCRQVMSWVSMRLAQKSTAEAEMVSERLEEELREYFHPEKTSRLPPDYYYKDAYNSIEVYRMYQTAGCGSGR
jgi:hypothetical protein